MAGVVRVFPKLAELDFGGCKLLNLSALQMMERAGSMRILKKISLDGCGPKITDGELSLLGRRCSGLEDLDLKGNSQLSSHGVSCLLDQLPGLVRLSVSPTMEAEALTLLSKHASKMRSLELSGNIALTDGALIHIAHCKGLEALELSGVTRLTDASVANLIPNLPNLKRFLIGHTKPTKVGDETVQALAENCPNIEELDLTNASRVTSTAFENLSSKCHQLKVVRLRGVSNLTNAAIEPLFLNCVELSVLDVRFLHLISLSGLTVADNYDRIQATGLRSLILKYSQLNVNTQMMIQAKCPQCGIQVDPFVPEGTH